MVARSEKGRIRTAIVGSGNIGTDLMYKLSANKKFEVALFAGIDPSSEGLARAKEMGITISTDGAEAVFEDGNIDVVFEATSAYVHRSNAPRYEQHGILAIDLTPAKVGACIVPTVNLAQNDDATNINLISCAAQATVPIVHAVSAVTAVSYAEIVATVASKSIGPGTRDNIEEFTHTTSSALADIGGAARGKSLIIVNPADPPILMRNTIYCVTGADVDMDAVRISVEARVAEVQKDVPGYRLVLEPFVRDDHVMIGIEVAGAGDFLPTYAGNLDIINAAAVAVAERRLARVNT
ncbi:acetaldehyde dehydrogenase (acetylating) [Filomicrobium sp.]|uniref:acetaldehyde dehydrogenase (acetylating) n=1 Tax=Filomicrobium sp. TaxID=2024831 RepID=UPI00258A0488|nr:acetaldehyde dehydrogenase (acetylating) [Filomicrobium sp.]MCV0370199.1 acetaldehyde dehydrogenase (acetylating) [Filomicrobium sp.]